MSNKYRARRRKMQSPAVCKKSGPGPVRLTPDQPGYPFTGILNGTIQLPSSDPRGFLQGIQLFRALALSPTHFAWANNLGPFDWHLGIDIDFAGDPANPTILLGTSRIAPPDSQLWIGSCETASYLTFSTRATNLKAGQPDPSTEAATVKLWR